MTKPQERQALDPRPEVPGLYGQFGKRRAASTRSALAFWRAVGCETILLRAAPEPLAPQFVSNGMAHGALRTDFGSWSPPLRWA
jgi:hypothetical protein